MLRGLAGQRGLRGREDDVGEDVVGLRLEDVPTGDPNVNRHGVSSRLVA
jgi:hypothetical protein